MLGDLDWPLNASRVWQR